MAVVWLITTLTSAWYIDVNPPFAQPLHVASTGAMVLAVSRYGPA